MYFLAARAIKAERDMPSSSTFSSISLIKLSFNVIAGFLARSLFLLGSGIFNPSCKLGSRTPKKQRVNRFRRQQEYLRPPKKAQLYQTLA